MHNSSFAKVAKLCGAALLAALLIVSSAYETGAQGTPDATAPATLEPTAEPTTAPTTQATPEATIPATRFPPCPGTFLTPTPSATPGATIEATAPATLPAEAEFTPGYLGIAAQTVDACGARVTEVVPGSPAAQAGLLLEDVVVAFNNNPLPNRDTLRDYVIASRPGDRVELVVKRAGQELALMVTIGSRPTETPPTAESQPTQAATQAPTAAATQSQ